MQLPCGAGKGINLDFFLGDHNHTYFFTHSELNVYLSMSSACIISDICTICNKVNGSCVQQPNNLQSQCLCNLGFAGNGKYCEQDSDLDGFPDVQLPCQSLDCKIDNCPFIPNSGQENNDADDLGNVCDIDDDNDNITDTMDNCQFKANSNQEDKDGDGLGDICDNCIDVPNLDQKDSNGDGTGDACESRDLDNDGIKNGDITALLCQTQSRKTLMVILWGTHVITASMCIILIRMTLTRILLGMHVRTCQMQIKMA